MRVASAPRTRLRYECLLLFALCRRMQSMRPMRRAASLYQRQHDGRRATPPRDANRLMSADVAGCRCRYAAAAMSRCHEERYHARLSPSRYPSLPRRHSPPPRPFPSRHTRNECRQPPVARFSPRARHTSVRSREVPLSLLPIRLAHCFVAAIVCASCHYFAPPDTTGLTNCGLHIVCDAVHFNAVAVAGIADPPAIRHRGPAAYWRWEGTGAVCRRQAMMATAMMHCFYALVAREPAGCCMRQGIIPRRRRGVAGC